jgi:hypothetical protein
MNSIVIFWTVFAVLLFILLLSTIKYNMLSDESILAQKKSYSYARTQLAWWTLIILSSYISILIIKYPHTLPDLSPNLLVLLGISSATLATARIADINDEKNPVIPIPSFNRNQTSESFLFDILSDKTGVSINRLQAVIFNFVIGCWFIYQVLENLSLPEITSQNLVLLSISAGTYAGLKLSENKL